MQETFEHPTVVAVIVTYRPEGGRLQSILTCLQPQCRIMVVDNGDRPEFCEQVRNVCIEKGIPWISMDGNKGIAAAQNAGIRWAIQQEASHVLLLDDDSLVPQSMVRGLLETMESLAKGRCRVACVGARALDGRGGNLSNAEISSMGWSVCRNLMSSGSLIPIEVIQDVGLMEETLFIDCVDYDWGWRAQAKGYQLYLANGVVIEHRLGIGRMEILGQKVGIPSPIRHYYQYRNISHMLVRSYVPVRWKIKQIVSLCLKPLFILVFLDQKHLRLRYLGRGVLDVIRGRQGKYAE